MSQELLATLEYIEKEKSIDKETLLETLKQALLSACRKTYSETDEFEVEVNPQTADIRVLRNGKEIHDADFGRIAAQTAKQIIVQKIREAERKSVYNDFVKKQGDIVSGTIHRFEKKAMFIDLGKTFGILPAREQSPKDDFRQGDFIKSYVLEIKRTPAGPEVILSRAHEGLVVRLFELEVPEIHDRIVEIKGVAREAGSRTKIAVHSSDPKIDPVGSCVGMRGQRVKNIVRELGGEKIDIIRWSEDVKTYIQEALKPAEISEVELAVNEKGAQIVVPDDQLSLAIGKKGQNIRLASKLVGWRLDVFSQWQKAPVSNVKGLSGKIVEVLKKANITTLKDLIKKTPEELMQIPGIGEKTAEKIIQIVHQGVQKPGGETQDGTEVSGAETADGGEVPQGSPEESQEGGGESTNEGS